MAAIYIRFRRGLADNSLAHSARHDLARAIDQESLACPVLRKSFLENINSFIEVFVLDAGKGLSYDFFKNEKMPKFPFREAWRKTIGLGRRGPQSLSKNTRYGGLFTIGQVLENNYLAARDVSEWIGDVLPIQGASEFFDVNRSYMSILTRTQVNGLALIGRISWKVASDENKDWSTPFFSMNGNLHPYRAALLEERDIYLKYSGRKFSTFSSNPYYIKDNKYGYNDSLLNKKYFEQAAKSDFCLFLPEERLAKNAIYERVVGNFLHVKNASKTLIIGDIPVWETGLYQYALEDAKYPLAFLSKYDKIILISKRLTVLVLKKSGSTFIRSKDDQVAYINHQPDEFSPDKSLQHYIEWLRTHDSMIFWRYLEQNNLLNEYYLRSDVEWYQGDQTINLKGYLNFSKTLTDSFCVRMYENILERSLSLANRSGCSYESIDVLTTRLCQYLNSIFYNKATAGAVRIFLGSVFVSGYSERASQLLQPQGGAHNTKVHFFYNTNTNLIRSGLQVMHLLLWPVNGEEWFSENVKQEIKLEGKGRYRRIGATHVIAPSGWKYFPIPRYKLINKQSHKFIDNIKLADIQDPENEFISIYKCSPPETYDYWQGRIGCQIGILEGTKTIIVMILMK